MARLFCPNNALPALLAALILLTACGNRGPLYLPTNDTTPNGGADAAPAPAVIESGFPEDPAPFGPAGGMDPGDGEDRNDDGADDGKDGGKEDPARDGDTAPPPAAAGE